VPELTENGAELLDNGGRVLPESVDSRNIMNTFISFTAMY